MTTYKMTPLTDHSWLLYANEERIGLVSNSNEKLTVMGSLDKKTFKNIDELRDYLGCLVIEDANVIELEKINGDIEGFPIKHSTWFNIETEPVPSYTKTDTSLIRYAAGYYALQFPNGWTPAFCPKESTLTEYQFLGPFKSKLEMQNSISQKNSSPNV